MNAYEFARAEATRVVEAAYRKASAAGALPAGDIPPVTVETPKDAANGDWACTFAMQCAKPLRMAPRRIAEVLVDSLDLSGSCFDTVEIAGPGFLNFTLGQSWYEKAVRAIGQLGADYGRTQTAKPEKVMVEFVSANPTGPMHMGNARGGVLGDCLAEVLAWAGNDVTREFYINDAGNQVDKFAHSVEGRYIQQVRGEDAIDFDPSWYQGDDIRALAHELVEQYGDSLLDKTPEERFAVIAGYGLPANIARMERDLKRYKIDYDVWFRESTLHDSGYVKETIDLLTEKGATYETEDGALWLRSTAFGCDKDDVLRRANGFYTYFAADIAYHRNKFAERGFDRVINIWGADHHGHVKRLQCALDALGLDGSHRLEIVLMQLVRMMQGGEVVRMSKRTGKSLTLTDLLDEIPVDAARFFFNSRAAETQMEFDLDLAIRQDSDNPLYYVQYAHARICSVIKNCVQDGVAMPDLLTVDLSVLTGADERRLIKQLALLPEEIAQAAAGRDPSRLNKYAVALAQQFHHFYNACRIKCDDPALCAARLALCIAARQTIANTLGLIGVDAPETM
ncbi:MAG: arginine--tRNA ligase [Agathobaculum sp.]|uniref:arginine--tRNA ligase n=1 Tax=Agathobaculum sp. TaxID=2048138 RepID=UPI0025C02BC3|nr:arginine--tRNA ligase [Agathobaculum sp.]MCI7125036.1 arginine--tRNA ligase [Agathobaculum sp.]